MIPQGMEPIMNKWPKITAAGQSTKPGEIACSLSHRNVSAAMIKNDWKKVLILEDDVCR
ncbi:MAG: glycosyltransferase family 25 protein [Chitinophagaceae bacterium]|nr:glycosyltransferase family 25 protein [Chitinophagaceae bacterium]